MAESLEILSEYAQSTAQILTMVKIEAVMPTSSLAFILRRKNNAEEIEHALFLPKPAQAS